MISDGKCVSCVLEKRTGTAAAELRARGLRQVQVLPMAKVTRLWEGRLREGRLREGRLREVRPEDPQDALRKAAQ